MGPFGYLSHETIFSSPQLRAYYAERRRNGDIKWKLADLVDNKEPNEVKVVNVVNVVNEVNVVLARKRVEKMKDIETPLRIGNARRKFKGKKKRKIGTPNNRTKLTGLASRSRRDFKCLRMISFLELKRVRCNGRENVRERGKLGRERLGREGGGFGRRHRRRERRELDRVTCLRLNAGMDGEEFDERGVRRRKARR